MYYPDGHSPPPDVIARWLTVLADTFDNKGPDETPCIAIHCVAGLGRYVHRISLNACNIQRFLIYLLLPHTFIGSFHRAPVLVAIALIEYGMDAISAVTFIRERRYSVLFFWS